MMKNKNANKKNLQHWSVNLFLLARKRKAVVHMPEIKMLHGTDIRCFWLPSIRSSYLIFLWENHFLPTLREAFQVQTRNQTKHSIRWPPLAYESWSKDFFETIGRERFSWQWFNKTVEGRQVTGRHVGRWHLCYHTRKAFHNNKGITKEHRVERWPEIPDNLSL